MSSATGRRDGWRLECVGVLRRISVVMFSYDTRCLGSGYYWCMYIGCMKVVFILLSRVTVCVSVVAGFDMCCVRAA